MVLVVVSWLQVLVAVIVEVVFLGSVCEDPAGGGDIRGTSGVRVMVLVLLPVHRFLDLVMGYPLPT